MRSVVRFLFAFLLIVHFVFSASAADSKPTKSSSSTTTPPMTQMPNVVPLFIEDGEFTSTLVLVNGSTVQTFADVTVRALDGKTVAMKRVQFQPHSQQQLEIRALLDAAGAASTTTGSITVMQSPDLSGVVITAVLAMTRVSSSTPNYVNEEIVMPSSSGSQFLRAVADKGNGSPLLAITSLADAVQHVQVQCLEKRNGTSTKTIELAAGETLLTSPCKEETVHGSDFQRYSEDLSDESHGPIGIALKSDAMSGSFAAFALEPHGSRDNRYFSSVAFSDPKMIMSATTVFAGVPVGPATQLPAGEYIPTVALANFSSKDRHVTVRYAQTLGEKPEAKDLESVTVPAQSSKEVTLDGLKGDPDLQNSFLIAADGAPGDVAAKLVARSDSQLKEVELMGKDLMDPQNGGNHPWSVEQGTESTLLLFNTSNAPQYFDVAITSGRTTWQKAYQLKPMQTMAIKIGDLIDKQIKDDKGKVLPKDIWSGQIDWYLANLNTGRGRILQSNRETAMARNFSCGVTINLCQAQFSGITYLLDGQVVDFGTIYPYVCMNSCSGTPAGSGCSGCTYSWSSEGSGIASISGSSTNQTVNAFGASPGSTYIDGSVSGMGCYAPLQPSPPAIVQVPMYFISPSAISTNGECSSGTFGSFYNVSYYVADQNSSRINQSGMTPLELAPGTLGAYKSFATPPTTSATGSFNDTPVGTCFPVPAGTQACAATFTVYYQLALGGTTHSITTSTVRRDCSLGQSLTIQGNNPAPLYDKIYTQGQVN